MGSSEFYPPYWKEIREVQRWKHTACQRPRIRPFGHCPSANNVQQGLVRCLDKSHEEHSHSRAIRIIGSLQTPGPISVTSAILQFLNNKGTLRCSRAQPGR